VLGIVAAGAFGAIATSTLWIGGILALGVAVAAVLRRRVPTAVLAFVTGLGPWWDGFIILGAIYVVLGFWLVRAGRQVTHDSGGARR
jgi:drug/metabolite transporter (DMT)-like permease